MAFNEKEIARIKETVKSASGRTLRYVEDKNIFTDAPKSGKGDYVVMKKIGDKRFKLSVFVDGKEAKGAGATFPTLKGMTSYGVKGKVLERVEVVATPEVEATEATLEAPSAETPVAGSAPEVPDVRQTPTSEVTEPSTASGVVDRKDVKEYLNGVSDRFAAV